MLHVWRSRKSIPPLIFTSKKLGECMSFEQVVSEVLLVGDSILLDIESALEEGLSDEAKKALTNATVLVRHLIAYAKAAQEAAEQ
jgi:hypothetical protein